MARIVITSWGSYGDLYPYIDLAHALIRRGHHPVLAVPAFYRQAVEACGIEHSPVGPDVDPGDRALIARLMDPVRGTEHLLCDLLMPALRQTCDQLRHAAAAADLLVSHPVTFAAPLLAEMERLP